MNCEQLVEIFNGLDARFIGRCLYLIRFGRHKDKKELADLLTKQFAWESADELLDNIESGKFPVTFAKAEQICIALNQTLEKVSNMSIFLRDNELKPEKEVLEDLKDELEYRIWKRQQEG